MRLASRIYKELRKLIAKKRNNPIKIWNETKYKLFKRRIQMVKKYVEKC